METESSHAGEVPIDFEKQHRALETIGGVLHPKEGKYKKQQDLKVLVVCQTHQTDI